MRIVFVAALIATLAGCTWFETTKIWTKAGATPEQASADLRGCKQIARAQESTDEKIDQDTAATMDNTGAVDTELTDNMSSQRSGERYDDIVASCMYELGYTPAR